MGCQHHAPAALPPAKTRHPWYRRLGGIHVPSGRVRQILLPIGIRSPDRPVRSESAIPTELSRPLVIQLICSIVWFDTHQEKRRRLFDGTARRSVDRSVQHVREYYVLVRGAGWPGKYVPTLRQNLLIYIKTLKSTSLNVKQTQKFIPSHLQFYIDFRPHCFHSSVLHQITLLDTHVSFRALCFSLTYLLTYSMQKSPSCEANCFCS